MIAKGIIYVHRHIRLAMLVTRGGKPRMKEKGPVRRFCCCGGDGGGNKDAAGDRDSKQSSDDAKPKRKVKIKDKGRIEERRQRESKIAAGRRSAGGMKLVIRRSWPKLLAFWLGLVRW